MHIPGASHLWASVSPESPGIPHSWFLGQLTPSELGPVLLWYMAMVPETERSFQCQILVKEEDSGVRQDFSSPGLLEHEYRLAPTWHWQPRPHSCCMNAARKHTACHMFIPWLLQFHHVPCDSPSICSHSLNSFSSLPRCINITPLEHVVNLPSQYISLLACISTSAASS